MKGYLAASFVAVVACSSGLEPQLVADASASAVDGGHGADGGGPTQDGGSSGDEVYRSGTRIKTKMLVTPDGAKVFQGMYDSERQEDCSFAIAADGVARCLPVYVAPKADNDNRQFADAECTIPAHTSGICTAIDYIEVVGCGYPRPRGKMHSAVKVTAIYEKNGTACTLARLPETIVGYALGPEIPPSSFQSATVIIE